MASRTARILAIDGTLRSPHYVELKASMTCQWFDELVELHRVDDSFDLALVSDEYWPAFSSRIRAFAERGTPTLLLVDGIIEWRNEWENPRSLSASRGMPLFQPILSHKAACIGRSQARTLESWGNLGKCEVVGVPRFDALLDRRPRARPPEAPIRLLVMTAKTPGFTREQLDLTKRSLVDLKNCLQKRAESGDAPPIEPVWRLTAGMDEEIGVENSLREVNGGDLASALGQVDAVITTPSTAMLESMLHGLPTALLDYHNGPRYVPAAWTISAEEHLAPTLAELVAPPPAKMVHQDAVLHDALECRSPATPRLVKLIEEMVRIGRDCRERSVPLAFPRRILADDADGHHLPEERFDLKALYPDHSVFSDLDRAALQAEVGHLRLELRAAQQKLAEASTPLGERIVRRLRRLLRKAAGRPESAE